MDKRLSPGFRVGHFTHPGGETGCTVILPPRGNVCSYDLRGSSPGSRELASLDLERRATEVHGILLTGGSAFGLAAADGVMAWLEEHRIGYQTEIATIPVVPAAVIFDMGAGKAHGRPDAPAGYAACEAAVEAPVPVGKLGAGTGATVGKWAGREFRSPGGLGVAVMERDGISLAALAVVNALGDVIAEDGSVLAGTTAPNPTFRPPPAPTDPERGQTRFSRVMTSATRRVTVGGLILLYVLAWTIGGALWTSPASDLDNFLLPASQVALNGHPLLIYGVRFQEVYPNDNGPLSLVPLTAVTALGSWLGWVADERFRRAIVAAAFSIFSLLMAREAVMAIDRLRGTRLAGRSRLLTYAVFAASPTLWQGVLGYGHVDVPITIWLMLYAVRSLVTNHPRRAGFGFGLAVLTRSIAALQLIPLVLLLLARHRWRTAAWLSGIAALTVFSGLLPFLLADRTNVLYSLVTSRANLPMVNGSLWQLARGTPYEWIAQRNDLLFIVVAAAVLSVIVIRARDDLFPGSRDVYGLLTLSALTLPLLAKSVWPYYFTEAYVFGAVWWLGQPGSLIEGRRWLGAVLPIVVTVAALVPELGIADMGRTPRLLEGVGTGVVLLVLIIGFTNRLRQAPPIRGSQEQLDGREPVERPWLLHPPPSQPA